MYRTLAPRLFSVGVPCCPVFEVSGLPAVPKDKLVEAHKEAVQLKWRHDHQDKPVGIVLGPFSALCLDLKEADLLACAKLNLPASPWSFESEGMLVCVYQGSSSPQNHYLVGTELAIPVAKHLQTVQALRLPSNLVVPTKETVAALPELPRNALSLLQEALQNTTQQVTELRTELDRQKSTTLGQIDAELNRLLTRFCYEILLNNRPMLPCLQELEALYDAKFGAFSSAPPPNQSKEAYFQRFFDYLRADIDTGRFRLPPNWRHGLGQNLRAQYQVPFDTSHQQKTFEQLKDYCFSEMSTVIGDDSAMLQACQRCMSEIALALNLTRVEQDTLKRFISRQSGLRLNMNQMESQMLKERQTNLGTDSLPSIAERALELLRRESPYRYHQGKLWAWNGAYWESTPIHQLEDKLYRYLNSPTLLRTRTTLTNLIKTILERLAQPLQRRVENGVNFMNGFVTENLQFLPHDPDMGLTYMLPFEYQDGQHTPPPKFLKFLTEIWGHEPDFADRLLALQEALASTFFGTAPSYQRAFLLYGVPLSGKSQLINIVKGLTPNLKRTAVPPHNWGDKDNLMTLQGKLLNICGELSEDRFISSQRFKDIVDGAELAVGHSTSKFGETLLQPRCAHWFASNHLPKTKDFSEGFTRRWQIFHFTRSIDPANRRRDLGAKIAEQEKDQIISWALQANPRLRNQADYTQPSSHLAMLHQLGNLNNNVRAFFTANSHITTQDVSFLKAYSNDELPEVLKGLPAVSGKQLHTLYHATTLQNKSSPPVEEAEFYRRTKELAEELGFLQVVGKSSDGRISVLYYGVEILAPN